MTTFYDEIVAGIVTLFKYCMQSDIYEKQTDFNIVLKEPLLLNYYKPSVGAIVKSLSY